MHSHYANLTAMISCLQSIPPWSLLIQYSVMGRGWELCGFGTYDVDRLEGLEPGHEPIKKITGS